ncbi:MAG: winged helix-turn-helix domain-containing protein [Candidatus Nezhaarchaeales archaeon]
MNEEKEGTKIEDMAGDFSVLSNPTRLKLLINIHEKGPCTLRELIENAQRDESTIKRHLKELIDRGFIARSCDKKPKYYITNKGILAITFLRVKVEPTIVQDLAKHDEVKVKVRSGRPFSNFSYAIKKSRL